MSREATRYLIRDVRLIPALSGGRGAEHGAVLLADGKIGRVMTDEEAAAACSALLREGIPSLDGNGRTLLPGLIDAHTHISGLRGFSSSDLRNPMRFFRTACFCAMRYLEHGFTTIRDCGSFLRVANEVRDAVSEGLFTGPRIISCGMILSPTEIEEADSYYDMYVWTDGEEACRRAARKELAEHADFVKVMASGSAMHRQGIPKQPIMTEKELSAVTEAAALKDSYVAAHAHSDGAIRLAAACGVRTIEHASFISDGTIDFIAGLKDPCYLIPTVSAMYQNPDTTPPEYQFLVKKLGDMLEVSSGCLQRAYAAGLPMGFGTDSCPGMDQYEQGIEFRYRYEKCGMKPLDILMQATVINAQILGIRACTGAIEEGLAADLVLVNGRPEEDISVMYQRPDAVWIGGKKAGKES